MSIKISASSIRLPKKAQVHVPKSAIKAEKPKVKIIKKAKPGTQTGVKKSVKPKFKKKAKPKKPIVHFDLENFKPDDERYRLMGFWMRRMPVKKDKNGKKLKHPKFRYWIFPKMYNYLIDGQQKAFIGTKSGLMLFVPTPNKEGKTAHSLFVVAGITKASEEDVQKHKFLPLDYTVDLNKDENKAIDDFIPIWQQKQIERAQKVAKEGDK